METNQKPAAPEDPRTRLAGERTLLAWVRTGLAMMGFGFVVARFGLFLRDMAAIDRDHVRDSTGLSLWIGTCLVVFGVAVNLLAALQHHHFLRRLEQGQPYQPPRWSLGIVVALLLALVGVAMTVYLLVLSI